MFVCLCTGVTSATVAELAAGGALSSRQIADACGAGSDCGRCRFTVRAIIESATLAAATGAAAACPMHPPAPVAAGTGPGGMSRAGTASAGVGPGGAGSGGTATVAAFGPPAR